MKVAVLAGGKGTRLGLQNLPKPLVPVAGKPLLERIVETAASSGFRDFVFLNGHLATAIEAHFGDGSAFGVKIAHCTEESPLGTAGAVWQARALLTETFILLYGDILLDVDLVRLARFHREHNGVASIFVHPNDHPGDSDLVEVQNDDRVSQFIPKPHQPGAILPNLVSAAIYVLDPRAIDFVPKDVSSDWGKDIFPAMLAAGEAIHGYRSLEYAKDIGTPDRLRQGEADLRAHKLARLSRRRPKPAVFLDRDGILNREINGVHRPKDMEMVEDAASSVRRLNHAGIPAICVTNQPDVAKGFITMEGLAMVQAALDTRLAEGGAYIDQTYFCPHHPETGWPGEIAALKIDCDCRKPKPGLLLRAAQEHNLDLARSWFIGDRYVDVAAARAAGARSILLRTGHSGSDGARDACQPDLVLDSLSAAVDYLLPEFG